MNTQVINLMNDIERCRTEMVQLASSTSLSDHQVVAASTRLDFLLNKYYLLTSRKNS